MIITATHRGLNHKFNNSNNDDAADGIGGKETVEACQASYLDLFEVC